MCVVISAFNRPDQPFSAEEFMSRLAECVSFMGLFDDSGNVDKKNVGVKKFLNRLLGIPAPMQHLLYRYEQAKSSFR